MKKKKMLLAHNNVDVIKRIKKEYENNEFITITETVTDGQALLNLKSLDYYDIVIVKNALSYITGLYALEVLLSKTTRKPGIMVLITPFINDFVNYKCRSIGVDYIPDFKVEENKIMDIISYAELNKHNHNKLYFDPSQEIIILLKQLGILRSYIGYTYFEYALNLMFEGNVYINKKLTEIYEIIANHFNVTAASVEKAMRSCIKCSFKQSNTFYSRLLFGHSIEQNNFPTTAIFIQVCIKTLKELKQMIINKNFRNSIRKI